MPPVRPYNQSSSTAPLSQSIKCRQSAVIISHVLPRHFHNQQHPAPSRGLKPLCQSVKLHEPKGPRGTNCELTQIRKGGQLHLVQGQLVLPCKTGRIERHYQRERETETETDRERQRETKTERDRLTEADRADIGEILKNREGDRQRERKTQRERERERQTDRQTERDRERQRQKLGQGGVAWRLVNCIILIKSAFC